MTSLTRHLRTSLQLRSVLLCAILVALTSASAPAITSDDFSSGTLNTTLWRILDNVGDATFQPSGTNLVIDMPGGTSHDLWNTCNCAPRLLQSAADTDFEIELKFDTQVALRYQSQGIVVQDDDDTLLRFDVYHDGVQPFIFAAWVDGAVFPTAFINTPLSIAPTYLRVERTGDLWELRYSSNGSTWVSAGTFTKAMTVSEVGLFIGGTNDDPATAPTLTASADYFFDVSNPISPEDGGAATAETPPVIEVWYGDAQDFGNHGNPQTLIQVMGRVWDPDPISTLTYSLNGAVIQPLSIGPDGLRLQRIGDYNVELDNAALNSGANTLAITATDSNGEQTVKNVTVNYTSGVTWPIPANVNFTTANEIADVAQVVDGKWILTPDGARTDSSKTGYDRLIVAGNFDWVSDYEVEVPIIIHNSIEPGGIGMALGWTGHTGSLQPKLDHPYEVVSWISGFPSNPQLQLLRNLDIVNVQKSETVVADTKYIMKVRTQSLGNGMARTQSKFWQDGTAEPADWELSDDFVERGGSVLLIAHFSDVTFGDVTVTPLPPWPRHTVTTNVNGVGSVVPNPNEPDYPAQSTVELTAVPGPGWVFDSWTAGLTGSVNPDTIQSLTSDTLVTANFNAIPYTLTVTVPGGGGTVSIDPVQSTYTYGDTVVLTANPDGGNILLAWGGDLSGKATPDTITIAGNTNITATFGPPMYELNVSTQGNGSVIKNPDKPLYNPGEQVTLTAVPDPTDRFLQWSGATTGNDNPKVVTVTTDMSVMATFVEDSGIVSDDFSSTMLDTSLWRFWDPVGISQYQLSGTNLLLDLAGGVSHDLWYECNCAPRFLQPSNDADFDVVLKFDSIVELENQLQGFVAHDDDDTWIRFDMFHDGSTTVVFAAFADNGEFPTARIVTIPMTVPDRLRVTRSADDWELFYSDNDSTWTSAGTFTQAMTVTEVGFFFGNVAPEVHFTPNFVGNIDYFEEQADPVNDDGGGAPAETIPNIEVWYGDTRDFGALGNPQTLVQVMGRVWDTDEVSSLSYTLNGGASNPLTVGPDGLRLVRRGDYNIELDNTDLNSGANTLVVTAIDTLGEQSVKMVTVNYTPDNEWVIPDSIDFVGANEIADVAQVVDGQWNITADGVRTDSSKTGYDRLLVAGNYDWPSEYEVVVPMTIHWGIEPGGVGIALGWSGHTGGMQPKLGHPYEAVSWITNFPASPQLQLLRNGDLIQAAVGKTINTETTYLMKVRSESVGGGMSEVSTKLWEQGSPEPGPWDLVDQFVEMNGSVLLIAHFADVTFGNFTVTPLPTFPRYAVTTNTVGVGTVGVSPDKPLYYDGEVVTFSATPDPGWSFGGWSGALTGIDNPDSVGVTSDTTVTATFTQDQYVLTINTVGNGSVTKTPNQATYIYGDTVIVTAVPDPGWSFGNWSDGLSGTQSPDTVIVFSDSSVTATFTQDMYSLSLTTNGSGSIARAPNQPQYVYGDTVIVTALPDIGWSFANWSAGLAGSENPDTVVVGSDSTITANFTANLYTLTVNTNGDGSITKTPDQPTYVYGDTVLVTAVPDPGWSFGNWSGGLSGSENPDTVVVVSDSSVTATFTQDMYTVTLNSIGDGALTKTPDQAQYIYGDTVVVAAVPDPGWTFLNWSAGLPGADNPDTLVVVSDTTVTGDFVQDQYTLALSTIGVGSITKTPDQPTYVYGDSVILQAVPGPGWSFGNWFDDLTGSENPDTVVVFGESMVTAQFTQDMYTLTLTTNGDGTVTRAPFQEQYVYGDTVVVTAVPDPGWAFDAWSDGLSGSENPDTVIVVNDSTVTADFTQSLFTLTVNTNGDGSVTKTPDQPTYAFGDSVILGAIPDPGWAFTNWSDGLSGSENPDTVVVGSDSTVTANFTTAAYTLTLNTSGDGSITKTPDQPMYAFGDSVILGAIPDPGWAFTNWSGGLSGSENPDTVVVGSDSTITANFTANLYTLTVNTNGDGSITKTPDQPTYVYGDTVLVTAVPDPGWSFGNWSGGLSGSENPDTVVVVSDSSVTATFTQDMYTVTLNSIGDGALTKTPDQAQYIYGDTVVVAAVPDPGWTFLNWSAGLPGADNPDTLVVVSDTTVTGDFVQDQYTLALSTIGVGSITKTPDQPTYVYGDSVILQAVPGPGWSFGNWFNDLTGSENPDTVVVFGESMVTAQFTQDMYTLTLTTNGDGSITKTPDQPTYVHGDSVVLTAVPDPGWEFAAWSDGLSGSENPDTVVVGSDSTVTANFTMGAAYTLTLNTNGDGSVTKTPDQPTYAFGDSVVLTAVPDSGWSFANWSDGLSGSENPDTVLVASDSTITANFVQSEFTLTVTTQGNGTVIKSPDQPTYNLNDVVTLTALPDSNWVFLGWSGDLSSSSGQDSVVVTGDLTVTATFAERLYTISTQTVGNGTVTLSPPDATYAPGQLVAFSATPGNGWVFEGWSGDLSGSQNPDTLLVNGNASVTATFVQPTYTVDVTVVGDGQVIKIPDKATYAPGEQVILAPIGANGMTFQEWSGDLTGSANPDTVVVDSSMVITATFESIVTGIGDLPPVSALSVKQNSPNPFQNATRVDYALPQAGVVEIELFDVAGRRVMKKRIQGAAGWQRFDFAGRDENGQRLAAGVYFYRIRASSESITRKMVIVR